MAMPEFPHKLIQKLKISSRAAAGLSAYDPDDPTLSNPPSLVNTIASLDPSPPDLRCSNCKGKLLRGNKSIICVYCGRRPKNDIVPEPISFASTIGYQWLLRSLKLDGSEMVKPVTSKTEKTLGQSFAKAEHEIPLSEYLNLKMAWPAETDEEETSVSDKQSGETRRKSLRFPGVAPDKFFFKSNKQDDDFDISSKQPVLDGQAGTQDRAVQNNLIFFQNAQSSTTAGISSKVENNEEFAEWEADFQFADQENQKDVLNPSGNLVGPSVASVNKVHESESFGKFTDFEFTDHENQQDASKPMDSNKVQESESFGEFTGDLSAHMDSMFGYAKDLSDGHQTDNLETSPPFGEWNSDNPISDESKNDDKLDNSNPTFGDDWNSDERWTNPISNESKTDPKVDFPNPTDLSTGFGSFPDFEWQTDNANTFENTTKNEDHHTINEDSFDEWNDFTMSSSLKDPISNTSFANENTSEIDLFNSNSKFEGDFGDFSQPDFYLTSTSNSSFPVDVNAFITDDPSSKRSTEGSAVSNEFEQAVKTEGVSSKSIEPKNEYEDLISQMHDLSFMLENDLSIPSAR